MDCELMYNAKTNALYEVYKVMRHTAVIKKSGKNFGYSVVTAPVIDDYSISWQLKFDNIDTLENAIAAAKGVNTNMEIYMNSLEIRKISNEIKSAVDNNYDFSTYCFDSEAALNELLENEDIDKVKTVVAVYIKDHDYDGRISINNKEWAEYYIEQNEIDAEPLSASISYLGHSGLVDLFAQTLINYDTIDDTLDLTENNS